MGRLQRYLRHLSEAEWQELHGEMQSSLGKATVALAERLRGTLRTISLNSGEREQAQRIERWLWRKAIIERAKRVALTQPTPIEWRLIGAELFYQRGLVQDAYGLLTAPAASPVQRFTLEIQRLYWQVQEGELTGARQTVGSLLRLLRYMRDDLLRQRMELALAQVLREHGSGIPPAARRLLTRIGDQLRRRPLPEGTHLRAFAERNLRLLYAIARSDSDEIQRWRIETLESPHAIPLLLNSWLSWLLEACPLGRFTRLLEQLPSPLYPQYESIASHLTLLTLLRYGTPEFIREKLPQIYGRKSQFPSPPFPERELIRSQLLWLAGEDASAHTALRELRQQVSDRHTFWRLQIEILYLLVSIDLRVWSEVLRTAEGLEKRLRRTEVATAPLLRKLIKEIWRTRLYPEALHGLNQRWETTLQTLPTEAGQWRLTLIPDWLQARLRGQNIQELRREERRATPQDLTKFWTAAEAVFLPEKSH